MHHTLTSDYRWILSTLSSHFEVMNWVLDLVNYAAVANGWSLPSWFINYTNVDIFWSLNWMQDHQWNRMNMNVYGNIFYTLYNHYVVHGQCGNGCLNNLYSFNVCVVGCSFLNSLLGSRVWAEGSNSEHWKISQERNIPTKDVYFEEFSRSQTAKLTWKSI